MAGTHRLDSLVEADCNNMVKEAWGAEKNEHKPAAKREVEMRNTHDSLLPSLLKL